MWFRRFLTPRTIAVAVGALVLVGVFGPTFVAPESGLLPPPSEASPITERETTTTVDHSQVELPTVAGETLAVPLVETGRSTIHGSVDVPEGRLPGASVRLERLVGDRVQQIDVATGEDGTFSVDALPGGRYRVRAWLAPTYTVAEPAVFFLADGAEQELHLRAEEVEGIVVKATTLPSAPIVGQGVNISVWVADRVVDPDGFAREQARPGVRVALSVSGLLEVDPGAVRTTDDTGSAVFEFSCERVAAVTATAMVGAAAPAPRPPDDDDDASDDDAEPTTTTTTTTPPESDVDVIDEVTSLDVPDCAPVPTTTTAPPADDEPAPESDDE